jgi:flagellar motor switch protein FliM
LFNTVNTPYLKERITEKEIKQKIDKIKKELGNMTDILSQDEIDSLLDAISSKEVNEDNNWKKFDRRSGKIRMYDFRRPDKFSKDQIRTIQMLHDTFARLMSVGLSAQLRKEVSIHLCSVDQLNYEEFIRSIPSPTTLPVISMDPLKGFAVLQIDPSISFTIIDLLFGGQGIKSVDANKGNRELTDIELSVMEGLVVRILGNLREVWSGIIDLRPRLGNIETNPQFTQIIPPKDMVILITFETKIGDVEGTINLCLPYSTLKPIIHKLRLNYQYSSNQDFYEGEPVKENNPLKEVELILHSYFPEKQLYLGNIMDLKVGDILNLGKQQENDPQIGVYSNG